MIRDWCHVSTSKATSAFDNAVIIKRASRIGRRRLAMATSDDAAVAFDMCWLYRRVAMLRGVPFHCKEEVLFGVLKCLEIGFVRLSGDKLTAEVSNRFHSCVHFCWHNGNWHFKNGQSGTGSNNDCIVGVTTVARGSRPFYLPLPVSQTSCPRMCASTGGFCA
jgi:hypothetical protein